MRDLQKIREKKKPAAPTPVPAPAPAPASTAVRAQPPAPMVIDLDSPKAAQASAPVAPMMVSASPSMQNKPNPKAPESKPVAPFPDMGMGTGSHAPPAAVPFHPVKAADGKRPSPKSATKPGPPSGRPAGKTSPLVSRQTPKAPAPAPVPSPVPAPAAAPPAAAPAPAPVPPPATNQPPSNAANAQNPFTNATFTLDPMNSDIQLQPGSQEAPMDLTGFDSSASLDGLGLDRRASGVNAEPASNDAGNDSTMDDLDHFFDLGSSSNTNFDENFNDMAQFMTDDFTFDTFE